METAPPPVAVPSHRVPHGVLESVITPDSTDGHTCRSLQDTSTRRPLWGSSKPLLQMRKRTQRTQYLPGAPLGCGG